MYKKVGNEVFFLLRQSSPSPKYPNSGVWSLPKGWLDDDADGQSPGPMTLGKKRASEDQIQTAALKEVEEEGGVRAKIVSRLGTIQFFFVDQNREKVLKTVIFYLMEYTNDLSEGFGSETSAVNWVSAEQAKVILKKRKGEAELISKAEKMISSGQQSLI